MAKQEIYPYAVARIRVLEKNLLNKQVLNQMADETQVEDCLRVLSDYGYSVSAETSGRDFESVLSAEMEKTYELIRELVPKEKFINVFLYKNDYHNLKVLVKEEVSGIDGERFLIDGGTEPIEKLKKALLDRNYGDLPLVMGVAIADAFESYAKTQNSQMIDVTLDKAAFVQMKQAALESGNKFIIDYMAKVCDLTNLKSFLRIKNMHKTYAMFTSVFVEGGNLSLSVFFNAFGMDSLVSGFKGTAYEEICEDGMTQGFTVFEKLCDNYIMNFVKSAKYEALTLEPLIAYLYAKESEIKTVRIILTSVLNGIRPDIIKERVREAYV